MTDKQPQETDPSKITAANRTAWNATMPHHRQGCSIDYQAEFAKAGYSTLDGTITPILQKLSLDGKHVAQLGCNNGRETLSMINLGASSAVGFDISDEAIKDANELREISGLNCRFVRTDVYDIGDEFTAQFDLIYISIGVLSWLPDLKRFFEVVARLLKADGQLVMYEQHPIMYLFPCEGEKELDPKNPLNPVHSYFRTEPWVETEGIDYVGGTTYESPPTYCYTQKLSDIINGVISGGIELKALHEYPHDISDIWGYLEKGKRLPLCYVLVAQKMLSHS